MHITDSPAFTNIPHGFQSSFCIMDANPHANPVAGVQILAPPLVRLEAVIGIDTGIESTVQGSRLGLYVSSLGRDDGGEPGDKALVDFHVSIYQSGGRTGVLASKSPFSRLIMEATGPPTAGTASRRVAF